MKTTLLPIFLLSSFLALSQQNSKKDTISEQKIEEVVMTKKYFKKEADRFVYDVANSPVSKGSTSFDLLKQTPLVSTTDDKNLKIAGKNNALIFINGRKTNMDAESLDQFLKNTPGENIQKIEVITTPGSEYQVESSDGIINIVLKKKMTDGTNGNLRFANNQNKYNSSSASASINFRKDKLGISASLNGSENIQAQSYILRNGNEVINTYSVGDIDDPNKNLGGYINADYQLSEKSNLALTLNSWYNKSYDSKIDLFNTSNTLNSNNNLLTSYSITKARENAKSRNNSANLNYEWKMDDLGSKLNLNASYLNYKRTQNTINQTIASNSNKDVLGTRIEILQDIPQIINNFSTTADYIKKFEKDFTIAVGGNYNKTKTDNDTKNLTRDFIYDTDGKLIDIKETPAPNHFVYDENIYGFYGTLEKKFGEKFSGKIGARYEITNSLGTSDNAQNPAYANIERNYNNFLPYLSANYTINENHNISYAFSSRMRRPSFWELNPVRNILTENNYTQNNPFVKASSNYNQELTYMFKNSYFLILNHSLRKDVITQVPLQRTITKNGTTYKELRYIRTNFGDRQEMSAMLGMQKSLFDGALSTNFNIGMQRNVNDGSLSIDPTSGDIFDKFSNNDSSNSLVIQTNNTLRLDKKKTWFLGVNYFFVDNQQIELGMLKDLMSLDLNIKKIWNEWTFSVGVDDILKTNLVEIESYQNGDYNYVQNNQYRQTFKLSIVYNFGNQKIKKARNVDSADKDIKSRTQ